MDGQICGCKGIRSCLVCEGRNGNGCKEFNPLTKKSNISQDMWQYCHICWKVQPPPPKAAQDAAVKEGVCPIHHSDKGFFLPGIQVIPDFVMAEEEEEMVHMIEQSPWKPSQSGRYKQDYGPKPNFKRRKVKPGGFTGLPSFIRPFVSRMTQLNSLRDFLPVEQCHLEYTPDRGSSIDLHFDDFWLWGNRLITINLLSDTYLLLKLDQSEHSGGEVVKESSLDRTEHPGDEVVSGSASSRDMVVTESSFDHTIYSGDEVVSGSVTTRGETVNESKSNESEIQTKSNLNSREEYNHQTFTVHSGISALMDTNTSEEFHGDKSVGTEIGSLNSQVKELLIPLPKRSLLVLSDDARYKWKHAIPREVITSRRIAVTLRELASEFLPGGLREVDGQKLLDIALTYEGSVVP